MFDSIEIIEIWYCGDVVVVCMIDVYIMFLLWVLSMVVNFFGLDVILVSGGLSFDFVFFFEIDCKICWFVFVKYDELFVLCGIFVGNGGLYGVSIIVCWVFFEVFI